MTLRARLQLEPDYFVGPGAGVVFAEMAGRVADATAVRAMGILSFWLGRTGPLSLLSCRTYFAGTS